MPRRRLIPTEARNFNRISWRISVLVPWLGGGIPIIVPLQRRGRRDVRCELEVMEPLENDR